MKAAPNGTRTLALTHTTDDITQTRQPLFAFEVQLAKATSETRIKLDVVAPSLAPRSQRWEDTATGEMVEDADCPRGIATGGGFTAVPKEALKAAGAALEDPVIWVEGAMPIADIDFTRVTGSYWLQTPPKGGQPAAYRIAYEALLAEGKALTSTWVCGDSTKLLVIYPDAARQCLAAVTQVHADALREPDEQVRLHLAAQPQAKQIEMARKVIAGMPDGAEYVATTTDEARTRKMALIEQALDGQEIAAPVPVSAAVATADLSALLEASVEQAEAGKKAAKKGRKKVAA